MSSGVDDGWGDDEDLDVSGLGDNGWGDDDDLFSDDDDCDGDGEEGFGVGFPPAAPVTASASSISPPVEDPVSRTGWGEGDFNDDHSERAEPRPLPRHGPTPTPMIHNLQSSKMMTELSNYVSSLDRMRSSVNAVLEFEYNTLQKAEELVEYYESRPQLAEYTRTKELKRMNYEVVLPYGHVETNKERIIAENLLPDNSIVSRASNQSLLADLLQVITGHDLIVRPQYLTICVATWCKFTIHLGDHGADMVDCRARLSLSLPTEEGDRLDIAEVEVSAIFSPSQPMVEFKVQNVSVHLEDYSKLLGVADFLNAMECHNEHAQLRNASPDIYRDAFLENSQRLLSLSSEGMRSAFQQMDSVVNIKGKIRSISNFIPDTDQVLAAEQEALAFAEVRKQELQQQQQQRQQPGSAFPRPPPPPPRNPNPSRDQPQNNLHNTNDVNRPSSILGGLVRSGWKTLAQSVVIPDEDPAIFGQPVPPPPRVPLYNKPIPKQKIEDAMTMKRLPIQHEQQAYPSRELQNDNIETSGHNSIESHVPPQPVEWGEEDVHHSRIGSTSRSNTDIGNIISGRSDNHGLTNTDYEATDIQCNDKRTEKNVKAQELTAFSGKQVEADDQKADKEEIDENFDEDGWDDFGLDDVIDNSDDTLGPQNKLSEQDQGEGTFVHSPDIVIVDSSPPLIEKPLPAIERKYNPEDDIVETRKRWVNPRPHRPYVKG